MPTPDLFTIIATEITEKQNGIQLNAGDDRVLKDVFLKMGGCVEDLVQGVLPQFDILKAVIISTYESGMIASDGMGARIYNLKGLRAMKPQSLVDELQKGRLQAVNMAEEVLGKKILSALLNIKQAR